MPRSWCALGAVIYHTDGEKAGRAPADEMEGIRAKVKGRMLCCPRLNLSPIIQVSISKHDASQKLLLFASLIR